MPAPAAARPAAGAALFFLLAALAIVCTGAFVVVPPAAPSTRSSSSISRSRSRSSGRLHVLDPASLPDPATVGAVVEATQQAAAAASSASSTAGAINPAVEALKFYVFSPSGLGATGLLALGIRMYTYFTAQSMMARLATLFATQGTTVELCWGNSLRNIFYYENKMEKLIIPAGEPNPQRFATIQEVCAKLQAAQKTSFDVIPYPEDFDDLKLPEGSVDTIVSTYMWCKRKDPYKTFEKAMRLLKDGGAFVFVEPVLGEGPVAGVRRYFGQVHRATNAFGDPSLDIKTIVERWANGAGKDEGFEVDVEVEERGFLLDPHMWGVIYKKAVERDVDYEPSGAEKRRIKRRQSMLPGSSKGFKKGGE